MSATAGSRLPLATVAVLGGRGSRVRACFDAPAALSAPHTPRRRRRSIYGVKPGNDPDRQLQPLRLDGRGGVPARRDLDCIYEPLLQFDLARPLQQALRLPRDRATSGGRAASRSRSRSAAASTWSDGTAHDAGRRRRHLRHAREVPRHQHQRHPGHGRHGERPERRRSTFSSPAVHRTCSTSPDDVHRADRRSTACRARSGQRRRSPAPVGTGPYVLVVVQPHRRRHADGEPALLGRPMERRRRPAGGVRGRIPARLRTTPRSCPPSRATSSDWAGNFLTGLSRVHQPAPAHTGVVRRRSTRTASIPNLNTLADEPAGRPPGGAASRSTATTISKTGLVWASSRWRPTRAASSCRSLCLPTWRPR